MGHIYGKYLTEACRCYGRKMTPCLQDQDFNTATEILLLREEILRKVDKVVDVRCTVCNIGILERLVLQLFLYNVC